MGKRISHPDYGTGTIMKLLSNNKIEVQFDTGLKCSVSLSEVQSILHS